MEAGEEDTLYYDGCVRTRMSPASEAVMGSDESHFNVSVSHSEGLT